MDLFWIRLWTNSLDQIRIMNDSCSILQEVPLTFKPGSAWRYGLGIDFLEMVLMKATGKSQGLLMKELIFEPLEMTNTGFVLEDS